MPHFRTPLLAVLAIITAVILLFPPNLLALPKAGQAAPDFSVVSTSGQSVSLDLYRGQVLLVDFFATWCQPCRVSIPHLVNMNNKYGKQGLQVIGMSADEDGERVVKAFADQYHVNYPVALASQSVLENFGVRSLPIMFVIDKKGKVAEVYRGFSTEIGRNSEQLIRKLLADK